MKKEALSLFFYPNTDAYLSKGENGRCVLPVYN